MKARESLVQDWKTTGITLKKKNKKKEGGEAKADCVSGRWQAGSLAKPTTFVHESTLRAAPPSPCERVRGDRARGDGNSGSNCCCRGDMEYDRRARTHGAPLGFRKRVGHPFIPVRLIVLYGIPSFLLILVFFVFFSLRLPRIRASYFMWNGTTPIPKVSWNGAPPKGRVCPRVQHFFRVMRERTGSFMVKSSKRVSLPRLIIQFQK